MNWRPERHAFLALNQRCRCARQRNLQNLVHVFDEMHCKLVFDIRRNFREILLVVLGKNDRPDSRAMSLQELLFDSPNRLHFSPKCDLSRHGYIASDWNLSKSADQGCRHCDTG